MKFLFERKIFLFFILVIIGIVALAILSRTNNESFVKTNTLVVHTQEVLYESEQVLSIIKDFESGSRGYVITGDSAYLIHYDAAKENIARHITILKRLTKDNRRQQERIDSLSLVVQQRIDFSQQTISLTNEKKEEEARRLIATRQGKNYMDHIRNIIGQIKKDEDQLLAQRKKDYAESAASFKRTFDILLAVAISFLFITAFLIRQNLVNRKRAEDSLKESNEKFLSLFYGSPVAMVIRDLGDGKILDVNDEYERLLGYKKQQLIGKTSFEAGMITDKHIGEQLRAAAAAKRSLKNVETKLLNAQKEVVNILVSVEHIHIGKRDCILSALLNITQRKIAEEQIRNMNEQLERRIEEKTKEILDKEQRYRFVLDNMVEGIQILDNEWKYIYANQSAGHHGGSSEKKLIGYSMLEKYPGIEKTEMFSELQRCMDEREAHHMDTEFEYPDGTRRWFELSIQPVPEGLSILSMDITERKAAEDEIKRLNEDLERKVSERTEELQAVNKELESFSYSVSHDLRAPLRAVGGYARMLEEDYETIFDKEGKRLLGEIQNNAKRMGSLIDDLLSFSRMGKQAVNKSVIDMVDLANITVKELSNAYPNNAKVMINKLEPALADYSMMMQVMTNLLLNGIKYTSKTENALIEISSQKKNGKIIYSIKDNGAGFDMQYAHKLFGVFQRLHTIDEFEGTGVGLAIVQRIISKHGGNVWAEGKVNKGATFYFSLPVSKKSINDNNG
jgi:PAS domain S-box-containing protein